MSAPALNNLAELYRDQGRYAEAEALFERAMAIPLSDVKELTDPVRHQSPPRDRQAHRCLRRRARRERLVIGHALCGGGARAALAQRSDRPGRREPGCWTGVGSPLTSERLLRIVASRPQMRWLGPFASVRARLLVARQVGEQQALVFVHGYNVGFESALKRIAQIAFDLDFSGTCLLFSWPSKAKLLRYVYDRDSADIAVNHLIEFLDVAAEQMPNTRFHFLAHSMGNVVLLSALEKMALRGGAKPRIALGEIVLAHPDVDQDRFRQLAKAIKDLAPRMTLYTSSNDRATWASKVLGGAGPCRRRARHRPRRGHHRHQRARHQPVERQPQRLRQQSPAVRRPEPAARLRPAPTRKAHVVLRGGENRRRRVSGATAPADGGGGPKR